MNGLELLQRLGEEMQHVPAIIITGRGSEERVVAAIEAGAFWYIEKPLKAPVLQALLDRALGRVRDSSKSRRLRGNCAKPGSWASWWASRRLCRK